MYLRKITRLVLVNYISHRKSIQVYVRKINAFLNTIKRNITKTIYRNIRF